MDSSFTDTERRFVLAEIIKVSSLDVSTLVDFVRSYNVEPDWLSMQLPGGRNMNQVIRAYETMFQVQAQQPPIPIPHLKRKSIDDLNEPMPKRLAISPVEQQQQQQQQPPPLHAPQPLPPSSAVPFNLPRNIQPRPAPNGYPTLAPIVASPPVASPAGAVRKRGRPSKADKEARANASTGYVPVAPMPSQASQPTFQAAPAPPRPTSVPSPPAQNPAAPPPPLPPQPPAAQSPYQAATGSYGAPKGGATAAGSGRSQAAGASVGPEEGNKSGLVRWRPITSPSDYPAMDKRGSRVVSDSTASRAPPPPPRETKNSERSERSPSVSNLISAPEPEMDYSTARAAAASRYSPTAAQAATTGHRIYGVSGGGGGGGGAQTKPAVEHLKHENNGHNLNAHAPVSNPA